MKMVYGRSILRSWCQPNAELKLLKKQKFRTIVIIAYTPCITHGFAGNRVWDGVKRYLRERQREDEVNSVVT